MIMSYAFARVGGETAFRKAHIKREFPCDIFAFAWQKNRDAGGGRRFGG
jgi:hypothetical protein